MSEKNGNFQNRLALINSSFDLEYQARLLEDTTEEKRRIADIY